MIDAFLSEVKNERILVIGDIMIDRYIYGTVNRISPEAPVPVVRHESTISKIGGAGNVALNVQSLGAHVRLLSIAGKDEEAEELDNLLRDAQMSKNVILLPTERRTTVKTRILAQGQHLLRMDKEDTQDIDIEEKDSLLTEFKKIMNSFSPNIVLIQDYDKGMLTIDVLSEILDYNEKRGVYTAVDPKKSEISNYLPSNLLKPNLKEFCHYSGADTSMDVVEISEQLEYFSEKNKKLDIVVTLSERGVVVKKKNNKPVHIPARSIEIVDVCGAGDAVYVAVSCAMKLGYDEAFIGSLCNEVGRQVCSKLGVATIDVKELQKMNFCGN